MIGYYGYIHRWIVSHGLTPYGPWHHFGCLFQTRTVKASKSRYPCGGQKHSLGDGRCHRSNPLARARGARWTFGCWACGFARQCTLGSVCTMPGYNNTLILPTISMCTTFKQSFWLKVFSIVTAPWVQWEDCRASGQFCSVLLLCSSLAIPLAKSQVILQYSHN